MKYMKKKQDQCHSDTTRSLSPEPIREQVHRKREYIWPPVRHP